MSHKPAEIELKFLDTIKNDKNIDKRDKEHGETPLMIACRIGKLSLVEAILAKGANVNCKDHRGRNALMSALYVGDRSDNDVNSICELLISRGCDVNSTDDLGRTPLMWAVSDNFVDKPLISIVKLFIDAGAIVDAVDIDGKDALYWAKECDPNSPITYMIRSWEKVNEKL